MSKIIVPKTLPDLQPYRTWPLLFFGGPVLGGGNWQVGMFPTVQSELTAYQFLAAIPCHWDSRHILASHFLRGPDAPRQLNWERNFLRLAAWEHPKGCVLFWIPKESISEPRKDGGEYAQDTFGEIAEWRGQMIHKPEVRIVVGVDPAYNPGRVDVMKRNFELALGHDFPIYRNMREVARAVAKMVRLQYMS